MAAGELIDYEELQMSIRGCGRPSQKLSAGEEKRFMSFYEKLHKLRDMNKPKLYAKWSAVAPGRIQVVPVP